MRICFLSYYPLPQSPNSAAYQRLAYLSQRHEVHILTTREALVPGAVAGTARVHRMPWPVPPLPGDLRHVVGIGLFGLYALFRVMALRWGRSIDFIYTFQNSECLVAWLLRLTRLRWVADILDLPYLNAADQSYLAGRRRGYSLSMRAVYLAGMRKALPRAELVIVVALGKEEGCALVLQEDFGVVPSKLLPVPNGVDLTLVQPAPPGEGGHEFTLLYVGFVSPRRGVDTLLEACILAQEKIPELRLQLIGATNAEDRAWLQQERSKMGGGQWVHYEGVQPHPRVLQCIQAADACIYPFPEKVELDGVIPIKLFEYLAIGRPVIAARLSGVARIVRHEWNGLLVQPGNPQAMAAAIVRLYNDNDLRARLAANARPSVEAFDWSNILPRIEEGMLRVAQRR